MLTWLKMILQSTICKHVQRRVVWIFSLSQDLSGCDPVCVCLLSCFSCVRLFETLRTVACQAPLSMGLSQQEYWSGLPFSPPGDLPDPGTEPEFLVSPAVAGRFFISAPSGKPYKSCSWCLLFLFAENPLPQNFPFPISGCFLLLWQLPQSFNMYLNSVHDWLAPRELQRRAGPFRIWTPN